MNVTAGRDASPMDIPLDLEPFLWLLPLVGSEEALFRLDMTKPEPRPFDWSGVAPRDEWFVRQVLLRAEAGCSDLLGAEYCDVARRILTHVVNRNLAWLRRQHDPDRLAAALVWLTGRGNGQLWRKMPNAAMLWSWFGVTDCASLGRSLREAADLVPPVDAHRLSRQFLPLGDPDLLAFWLRTAVVDHRDRVVDRLTAQQQAADDTELDTEDADRIRPIRADKVIADENPRLAVVVELDFGGDHPHALHLTIPDAHHLVRMIQGALDAPIPLPSNR